MALVFAVLVIIYIFVKISEKSKEYSTMEPSKQKDSLKTNARLEQELLAKYFKEAYAAHNLGDCWCAKEEYAVALKEAHRKAQEEITKRGFVPCIPLKECWHHGDTAYVPNVDTFDSLYIRTRRERLIADNGKCTEGELYTDFDAGSLTIGRYFLDNECKRRSVQYQTRHKPGDLVTCTYGLCKVKEIQHNWDGTKAYYILEQMNNSSWFKPGTFRVPVTDRVCSVDQSVDD